MDNLVDLIRSKMYFLSKDEIILYALEKGFIHKKNITKDEGVGIIRNNLNEILANELVEKYSNKIGFTASEIEQHLNITSYERKKWTKKGYLKVTGYYEARAYGQYLDCPIYDAIQVLSLHSDVLEGWRNEKKPNAKQLDTLKAGRNKMIENRTCKECGRIQVHKKHIIDGLCSYCREEKEHWEWLKAQRLRGKNKFLEWANNRENYLILDVETTGLEYDDMIIEISIIDLFGNVLYDSLIYTSKAICEEAYHVHGITFDMIKDKPTWKEEFSKIQELIEDKTLLIFNADFDERMIYQTNKVYGLEYKIDKCECVMRNYARVHGLYSEYYGDFKWISLKDATGQYQDHRSLGDCLLVLQLIDREASKLIEEREGNNNGIIQEV